MSDLSQIANQFRISGEVIKISAWGGGHINDTYKVQCNSGADYILQKVNTQVFTRPNELMQNILEVTNHILQKSEFHELVVKLISANEGTFWINNDSGVWRMYPFVKEKSSYDVSDSREICNKAGLSYGSFLASLNDFPLDRLHITIPKFHDIRFRLEQFQEALDHNLVTRINEAKLEIEQVQNLATEFVDMYEFAISNLPLRVTHNDTKLNNVLIGDDDVGTVIDLDTVMPGFSFFDVGDALRSVAISAKEDDPDIDSLSLHRKNIKAFLEGYLGEAEHILTQNELQVLPKSGAYMAFIMAVRFLTDYLQGDIYYKTTFADHNLVRAKNQLKVCTLFTHFEKEFIV